MTRHEVRNLIPRWTSGCLKAPFSNEFVQRLQASGSTPGHLTTLVALRLIVGLKSITIRRPPTIRSVASQPCSHEATNILLFKLKEIVARCPEILRRVIQSTHLAMLAKDKDEFVKDLETLFNGAFLTPQWKKEGIEKVTRYFLPNDTGPCRSDSVWIGR